jgi:hypothetical protein
VLEKMQRLKVVEIRESCYLVRLHIDCARWLVLRCANNLPTNLNQEMLEALLQEYTDNAFTTYERSEAALIFDVLLRMADDQIRRNEAYR